MFLNRFEHFENVRCGLVYFPSQQTETDSVDDPLPVSLECVEIRGTVVHAAAEVIVTQTYVNRQQKAVDTIFYFPVHTDDFVTGFEVEFGSGIRKNLVIGEPLTDSEKSYEEAVKYHPTRFAIGPGDPPDVYQTRVGVLKPGESIVVTIAYVTEVKLNVDKIQLKIPDTVVPRYQHTSEQPPEPEPQMEKVIGKELGDDDIICIDLSDDDEDSAKKKLPEVVSTVDKVVVGAGVVKINVEFIFQGESSIGLLECDSHVPHLAVIDQMSDKENWTMAKIVFEGTSEEMDRDFVVSITPTDPLLPRIYVEETNDETVLMATICPILAVPSSNRSFLFAVDSGPDEDKNLTMHRTIKFLLRSLRSKTSFNIVRPWSQKALFSEFQAGTNGESVRKASRLISLEDEEDDGSVSTSTFLEKVFTMDEVVSAPSICQIILVLQKSLKVDEMEACESLVRRHNKSHKFRLFVVGIGVPYSQLEGLAVAGGGIALQIPVTASASTDSSWQSPLSELMTLANSPSLTDIKLSWTNWQERSGSSPPAGDDELEIIKETAGPNHKMPWVQVPDSPRVIFSGTQLVTFGIFNHKFYPTALDVQGVSYVAESESLEFDYNVKLTDAREDHTVAMDILTKLAYAKGLKQLEEMIPKLSCPSRKSRTDFLKTKEKILQIATREGIPSKYTYFATVDLETGAEVKGHWTRQTRFTDNISGCPTSTLPGWNSRIPYGSIARNKLSSIRKSTDTTTTPVKIARTDVVGGTDDLIDLTEES